MSSVLNVFSLISGNSTQQKISGIREIGRAMTVPEDLDMYSSFISEVTDISFSTASYRETVVPGDPRTLLSVSEDDRIVELWSRRCSPGRASPVVLSMRAMELVFFFLLLRCTRSEVIDSVVAARTDSSSCAEQTDDAHPRHTCTFVRQLFHCHRALLNSLSG
jgi:hypothetical protein